MDRKAPTEIVRFLALCKGCASGGGGGYLTAGMQSASRTGSWEDRHGGAYTPKWEGRRGEHARCAWTDRECLACIRVERAERHRVVSAAVDDDEHEHRDDNSDDDTSDDQHEHCDDNSDDDTADDHPDYDDDDQEGRAPEGEGQGVLRRQAQ
jgi:hypothetical protein